MAGDTSGIDTTITGKIVLVCNMYFDNRMEMGYYLQSIDGVSVNNYTLELPDSLGHLVFRDGTMVTVHGKLKGWVLLGDHFQKATPKAGSLK